MLGTHTPQLTQVCDDPVIRSHWHALAATPEVDDGEIRHTLLLGEPIRFWFDPSGSPHVEACTADGQPGRKLASCTALGYLWAALDEPTGPVFAVPEADEPDRRTLNMLSVGIEVSPPRAVENFLDMAHFPYVHTGILGAEPHTEVVEYNVSERDGEIWATECRFHQPRAAASSSEAVMAEYIYRVPHPYAAMLYKSSPGEPERMDAIGIFIHPLTDTLMRAHLFSSLLDDVSTNGQLRRFQQGVISQDKPILENQYPKLLPLDPRAETPIRADRCAIAYRRWLSDLGVTYGVIPV